MARQEGVGRHADTQVYVVMNPAKNRVLFSGFHVCFICSIFLIHSSSHIIGLGIRGKCPHGTKCWLYFPEDDCPFYRTTVFSNYAKKNCPADEVALPTLCMVRRALSGAASKNLTCCNIAALVCVLYVWSVTRHSNLNKHRKMLHTCVVQGDESAPASSAPAPGPFWSLMFEVSESQYKPVGQEQVTLGGAAGTWAQLVRDTIQGAINTQLIQPGDEIVSIYHRCVDCRFLLCSKTASMAIV